MKKILKNNLLILKIILMMIFLLLMNLKLSLELMLNKIKIYQKILL